MEWHLCLSSPHTSPRTHTHMHTHTRTHTHTHTHAHAHGLYIMYTCIVCQHGLRCTSAHIRMYLATALINSSVTRHYKSRQNERNVSTVSEGRQVRESGHTLAMGINEGHNIKCALSASNVTNACISYWVSASWHSQHTTRSLKALCSVRVGRMA